MAHGSAVALAMVAAKRASGFLTEIPIKPVMPWGFSIERFLAVFGGMDPSPAVSPAPRTISSDAGKKTQAPPAAAEGLN